MSPLGVWQHYEAGLAFNRIYAGVTPSLAHWRDKVPTKAKQQYLGRQAVAPLVQR